MDVQFPDDPEDKRAIEARQRLQLIQNDVLLSGLTSHLNGLNHRLDIQMSETRQLVSAIEKMTL